MVRSGAHRAAQAHIIACVRVLLPPCKTVTLFERFLLPPCKTVTLSLRYSDHPVVIRAIGRMCSCICLDSACATLLRDLDLQ